jgi:hypothetical protein
MAVSPLNNPLTSSLGSLGRPLGGAGAAGAGGVRPGAAGQSPPGALRPQAPAAARPSAPLAAAGPTLSSEPPAGTDPALWSVLTGEERAFFAKAAASGPLTYSRLSSGVQALAGTPIAGAGGVARGGRLDVRG